MFRSSFVTVLLGFLAVASAQSFPNFGTSTGFNGLLSLPNGFGLFGGSPATSASSPTTAAPSVISPTQAPATTTTTAVATLTTGNCNAAVTAANLYADAATKAATSAQTVVNLAVSAQTSATAVAQTAAQALAQTQANADVAKVSSTCVVGFAASGAKTVADALANAEAQASATAQAAVVAFADARAAAAAAAVAGAAACGCEDVAGPIIVKANQAFSQAESLSVDYQNALVTAETNRNKAVQSFASITQIAVAVAKPQCVACPNAKVSGSVQSGSSGSSGSIQGQGR